MKRILVAHVGGGGTLALSPDRRWLAIEHRRRWDGLDIEDIVFVNTSTLKVWKLSHQAGREIHVNPLTWSDNQVHLEENGAFSESKGRYVFDLDTGQLRDYGGTSLGVSWEDYSAAWSTAMPVPDPESPDDGVPMEGFWSFGGIDVSRDGMWAVAWLQPDWPAPIDELFPVYLLDSDGGYERLPLSRPVLFAETLGVEP